MKKKTLSILIAVLCMLCCVFGLTGCGVLDKLFNRDGDDDPQPPKGDDGNDDDDHGGNGGNQGTTPTQGALDGKTFEFYDVTCDEEYPYINSIKQGYTGTTVAFEGGVCTFSQGNMTYSGAYTLVGDAVGVAVSEVSSSYLSSMIGSTVEFAYADDELIQDGVLPASASSTGQEVHLHFIFRLQTIGGIGDMSGELQGKSFAFDGMTSTILDSSAVNTVNVGYSDAVVTFDADGTFVLVIDPEHSAQSGTYFFDDGAGYMHITRFVVDREEQEIPTATYTIELSGDVLTLSAAEMVFTYILAE